MSLFKDTPPKRLLWGCIFWGRNLPPDIFCNQQKIHRQREKAKQPIQEGGKPSAFAIQTPANPEEYELSSKILQISVNQGNRTQNNHFHPQKGNGNFQKGHPAKQGENPIASQGKKIYGIQGIQDSQIALPGKVSIQPEIGCT